MYDVDGAAVRALVETLPPHVFDEVVSDLPELLEGLQEWQVREDIKFIETDEGYTPDDVAKEQGYEDVEDMYQSGPYFMVFDDGVLIIE